MTNRDNPKAVVLEFLREVEKHFDEVNQFTGLSRSAEFYGSVYAVAGRMYGIGLGQTMPLTPPQAQERRTH